MDAEAKLQLLADNAAIDPGDGMAHFNLGLALKLTGRPAEAAAHFREALRINPGDADARAQLAALRGEDKP